MYKNKLKEGYCPTCDEMKVGMIRKYRFLLIQFLIYIALVLFGVLFTETNEDIDILTYMSVIPFSINCIFWIVSRSREKLKCLKCGSELIK